MRVRNILQDQEILYCLIILTQQGVTQVFCTHQNAKMLFFVATRIWMPSINLELETLRRNCHILIDVFTAILQDNTEKTSIIAEGIFCFHRLTFPLRNISQR